MKYSYEILPRPIEIGGGWRLRLLEDGAEVDGGVYPAPPAADDDVRAWWTALDEVGRAYWQSVANSRDPVKAQHAFVLAESYSAAETAACDWLEMRESE